MASIPQPIDEPTLAEILQRLADTHRALATTMEAQAATLDALVVAAPVEGDPLLTVAEAAAILRRSPSFIRAKCKSGAIKAMRDCRSWRVRSSALAHYERKRTA